MEYSRWWISFGHWDMKHGHLNQKEEMTDTTLSAFKFSLFSGESICSILSLWARRLNSTPDSALTRCENSGKLLILSVP